MTAREKKQEEDFFLDLGKILAILHPVRSRERPGTRGNDTLKSPAEQRTKAQLKRSPCVWAPGAPRKSLFNPLRTGQSGSPRPTAPSLFTEGKRNSIDFNAVHTISANVFRVRKHTLHVEKKHTGADYVTFEIFDLTEGTGPFRIRAGPSKLKPPAFVGNRCAWAAQAHAISQGWMNPKGGTR